MTTSTLSNGRLTWHIKAQPITLTLSQFCGLHSLDITVHRREDDVVKLGAERYYASFDGSIETIDGAILSSPCGNGRSTRAALTDLARQISKQTVVLDAYRETRHEFTAPTIKGL